MHQAQLKIITNSSTGMYRVVLDPLHAEVLLLELSINVNLQRIKDKLTPENPTHHKTAEEIV